MNSIIYALGILIIIYGILWHHDCRFKKLIEKEEKIEQNRKIELEKRKEKKLNQRLNRMENKMDKILSKK